MCVGLDQSGQQRAAMQIDAVRIPRRQGVNLRPAADAGNHAIDDIDRLGRFIAGHGHDGAAMKNLVPGRRRGPQGQAPAERQQDEDEGNQSFHRRRS